MLTVIALLICCLTPSAFCVVFAAIWGTPEAVLGGTILGGCVGVLAALCVLA